LHYFKKEYYNLPLPKFNFIKLFIGLGFRYFLNAIISIFMIYTLFKDFDAVKFASSLYLLFFVILIVAFFGSLSLFDEVNKMNLFYIRRFLIQPIFLLLFVPAFYYQKKSS
jgi:exosortase F-associated protein